MRCVCMVSNWYGSPEANQLMRPAATEFFPDKPYSRERFSTYDAWR